MSSRILFVTIMVCAFLLSGCSFVNMNPYLQNGASLNPESMKIWARPMEYGLEDLGDVDARAYCVYLFGFWAIAGDTVSIKIPFLGKDKADVGKLGMVAAARAIDRKPGANGIYVLRTEESGLNFFLFKKKNIVVRGKALKIKDLGIVTEERADRIRALGVLPAGATEGTDLGQFIFGKLAK